MNRSKGQLTKPVLSCRPLQRQEGHTQRFIREVNTTSRSCVLWDLEEETDYIIQVQSIGLYGESQASKKVHFRTLKKSDRFPSNSSNQGGFPHSAWELQQLPGYQWEVAQDDRLTFQLPDNIWWRVN